MNLVPYNLPEPVEVETTVNGELRAFTFKGTVTPADPAEVTILDGLVACGLATIPTGKAAPKTLAAPETTEEQ